MDNSIGGGLPPRYGIYHFTDRELVEELQKRMKLREWQKEHQTSRKDSACPGLPSAYEELVRQACEKLSLPGQGDDGD